MPSKSSFAIKFKGSDPERVMRVVNSLASFFIDENLKVREAQAISTSAFLDDELTGVRNTLNAIEKKMMEIAAKNLPYQRSESNRLESITSIESGIFFYLPYFFPDNNLIALFTETDTIKSHGAYLTVSNFFKQIRQFYENSNWLQ